MAIASLRLTGWSQRGMPQIVHPSANTITRVTVFGAVLLIAGMFGGPALVELVQKK